MEKYRIIKTENVTPLDQIPEPIQEPSVLQKIARVLIAILFIAAMLYLGGGYQFARFQTTPADTTAANYSSLIEAPTQSIPTTVFVLTSGSEVNEDRINQLVSNANEILQQAAVQLGPVEISNINTEGAAQPGPQLVHSPRKLQDYLPPLSNDQLYVVVTETLGGINGVAFSGTRVVAVAEYTTSFDFRVLAHEVGHALSLQHVDDKSNLMNSGSSGTELTESQAMQANQAASSLIDSES